MQQEEERRALRDAAVEQEEAKIISMIGEVEYVTCYDYLPRRRKESMHEGAAPKRRVSAKAKEPSRANNNRTPEERAEFRETVATVWDLCKQKRNQKHDTYIYIYMCLSI